MSTITLPPQPVNPNEDAGKLHKAFKGIGCDTTEVINILAHRDAMQRAQIQQEYQVLYKEELRKRLISELHGNLEKAMVLWLPDPALRDATIIKKGLKSDMDSAIEVICSRTPTQIQAIKEQYQAHFNIMMEQEIGKQTSGDLMKVLLAYVSPPFNESWDVDKEMVQMDVNALYRAGEKKFGTDEKTFIKILGERSWAHLRACDLAYRDKHGHTLKKAIKKETSGQFMKALLTPLQCADSAPKFFAKILRNAMKGMGTDDEALLRVIVSRAEIDMQDIKTAFLKKYGKTLYDDVKSETSGNYRTFLLALIGSKQY